MGISDEFFEAARPIWAAQRDHPFVQGIADGSLDRDMFRHWVRQDYVYLVAYARVLSHAAAQADRPESRARYEEVHQHTVDVEMDLHRRYAARFGVTEAELEAERPWPTTRAYTEFLLRAVENGTAADAPAVLLPCEWGFLHLADSIAADGLPDDTRYADWITQYTSPEYREGVEWLKAEFDRVADTATGEERERLRDLFMASSRYELRFWDMCWRGEAEE